MGDLQTTNKEEIQAKKANVTDVMFDAFSIKDKTIIVDGVPQQVDRMFYFMNAASLSIVKEIEPEVDQDGNPVGEVEYEFDRTLIRMVTDLAKVRTMQEADKATSKKDEWLDLLIKDKLKSRTIIADDAEVID